MIPLKSDLDFDEILQPSGWCMSGHPLPPGVKAYMVKGPALLQERWGQYCEPCVIVARRMARRQKDRHTDDTQVK